MSEEDFSIYSIEDLQYFKANALNTYKLIKRQIAGIPPSEIPTLKQIELDSLEKKIKLYDEELYARQGGIKEAKQGDWKSQIKALVAANKTKKAIVELVIFSRENRSINNQVLLLSNRLKRAEYDERNMLKSNQEISIDISRINHAILDLLENWK